MAGDDSQLRTHASLLLRLRHEPHDEGAWGEFVERYGRQIAAWCRQWRLQAADAEDVTQNVLLKLAGRLRTFDYDPSRRFRGLLRVMAHNACKDYLDGQRRAVTATGDDAVHAVLNSVQARDDLAARLERAFDQERLELAQASVRRRVEPHTWEAFRLTALGGQSGAEAAAQLGLKVGTVFKAKSKVQQMLRAEVERLEGEEPTWLAALPGPNSRTS
jgi:RNA polymerase sigma-70 factor (ECF subfamily)